MTETAVEAPDLVQSLRRGVEVIEVLSASAEPMTLSEVARACDLTRASARRFLHTLRSLDYVAEADDGFSLRPKIMELGEAFLACSPLARISPPHLARLAQRVQDTCSVTVLDGDDVVYVARVKASRIFIADIDVGTRFPAYATSTGRVLLSGLSDRELDARLADLSAEPLTSRTTTSAAGLRDHVMHARRDGFVIADQELDSALRSVAVPVRGPGHQIVAAVNVSTHVSRTSLDTIRREVLPELRRAADDIAADLAVDEADVR